MCVGGGGQCTVEKFKELFNFGPKNPPEQGEGLTEMKMLKGEFTFWRTFLEKIAKCLS